MSGTMFGTDVWNYVRKVQHNATAGASDGQEHFCAAVRVKNQALANPKVGQW